LQSLRPNETALIPQIQTTTEYSPCADIPVNCTFLDEYASYEAVKNTNAVLVFFTNLTTLLPGHEVTKLPEDTAWKSSSDPRFNLTGTPVATQK